MISKDEHLIFDKIEKKTDLNMFKLLTQKEKEKITESNYFSLPILEELT